MDKQSYKFLEYGFDPRKFAWVKNFFAKAISLDMLL